MPKSVTVGPPPFLDRAKQFIGDEFYLCEEAIHIALYASEHLLGRNVPLQSVKSRRATNVNSSMKGFEVEVCADDGRCLGFFVSDSERKPIAWKLSNTRCQKSEEKSEPPANG